MKWLFILLLLLVPLGVFVLRPLAATRYRGDFAGIRTEVLITPIVTLAVFLCSFMGFQTTNSFQKARLAATNEGSAMQQFFDTAITRVEGNISRLFLRTHPTVTLPCDDEGTPV